MTSIITTDLFLALVILTSMVLVLVLLYFLIRCVKRHEALPHSERSVEGGQGIRREQHPHRRSRSQIQQEHHNKQQHYMWQQCFSSLPPAIELLPKAKISEDKAEEWLERGKSNDMADVMSGHLGAGCGEQILSNGRAGGTERQDILEGGEKRKEIA